MERSTSPRQAPGSVFTLTVCPTDSGMHCDVDHACSTPVLHMQFTLNCACWPPCLTVGLHQGGGSQCTDYHGNESSCNGCPGNFSVSIHCTVL